MKIAILLVSFFCGFAHAAPKNKAISTQLGARVSTQHDFNELTVRGQYQTGFEGMATVENEKNLDDLLDYRTELKDRIRSSARYQVR